jgi:crotonobetainyl-CoA:carnitine CoA-transferase CaiB-like acyl-CoA transferase
MTPLAGIRVVEASAFIAGPFATMILADLGAEVIKVEPPRGEAYRRLGDLFGDSSLLFRGVNQNKDGVVLDLKSVNGLAQLRRLLADADIFLTNWRPGVAESLGLTEASLRSEFPKLIWVRVSGYGQTGPKANQPAYDNVIHAQSGAMLAAGAETGLFEANSNVADKVTAMTAAQTATAALLARANADGQGMVCDVSMVDSNAYFYGGDISTGHRVPGAEVDPFPAQTSLGRTVFETSDGWITLVPVTGRQLRSVLNAIGEADRWEAIKADGAQLIWPRMLKLLEPALLAESSTVWQQRFTLADVPVTVVCDFEAHLKDEQVAHNGTYTEVADPGTGRFLQVRYPGLFDREPVGIAPKPAPGLRTPT